MNMLFLAICRKGVEIKPEKKISFKRLHALFTNVFMTDKATGNAL